MAKLDKYIQIGKDLAMYKKFEWGDDLVQANMNKVGAPFQYTDGLIMGAVLLRTAFEIPYRQLSGVLSDMMGGKAPHYSAIFKRMQKIDIEKKDGVIVIGNARKGPLLVVDAVGIKQYDRGEWISKKWKVKHGLVKMHALIDAKTREVLAVAVTDGSVSDTEIPISILGQYVSEEAGG